MYTILIAYSAYPRGWKSSEKVKISTLLEIYVIIKIRTGKVVQAMKTKLTMQEKLKDLRIRKGLNLEQLAEQTQISKSALGSYEADEDKDISLYNLIELAKFYEVI